MEGPAIVVTNSEKNVGGAFLPRGIFDQKQMAAGR
jgi:hypothetical protein